MRKIFTLLFIFGIVLIQAQTSAYNPFPETHGDWLSHRSYRWSYDISCSLLHTESDTVINSKTYIKVFESDLGIYRGPNYGKKVANYSKPITQGDYAFSYRNDAPNKKVYILYKDSVNEHLWYNFDYKVGDTLKFDADANYNLMNWPIIENNTSFTNTGILPLVVKAIENIKICNEFHKKFIFFNSTPFVNNLIEGVGFETGVTGYHGEIGFFEPFYWWEMFFSSNDNCSEKGYYEILSNSVQDISSNEILSIYPNPAQDKITLNINSPILSSFNYSIVNSLGQEVLANNCNSNTIDISTLPIGIYFCQLIGNDGELINVTFVKE
jgi:hypothetical protein